MSGLSWLIFIVGMCDKINDVIVGITITSIICFVILTVCRVVIASDDLWCKERKAYGPYLKRLWTIDVSVVILAMILQIIVPTKQTAVLMAASEIGQQVLQSRQANAISDKFGNILGSSADLLQTWINKETSDIQSTMKSK